MKLIWRTLQLLVKHSLLFTEILCMRVRARLGNVRCGKVYFCITVDGDGHGVPNAIEKGVPLLFDIFDRKGLTGRLTWFINERYDWTGRYSHLVELILSRGERIELHCHIEASLAKDDLSQIINELSSDKQKIESFARGYQPNYRIACFRSGSLRKTGNMMNALEKLEFHYDSSVSLEEAAIPNCYFINPEDYIMPSNKPAPIVELPVYSMLYDTPRLRLKEYDEYPLVITNLVHPYNLITDKGNINKLNGFLYELELTLLKMVPNAEFVTLFDAGEAWRQVHSYEIH